jgi:hypothetical protein
MKAIGRFQKVNDLFQFRSSLFTRDESSFYTYENGHHSKSSTTAGYDHLVILRIIIVDVKTFPTQATHRFRALPEVLKGLFLYQPE